MAREKASPKMIKILLRMITTEGDYLSDEQIQEVLEERDFANNSEPGDSVPEAMAARIRKRGPFLDYAATMYAIMEKPKNPQQRGYNRKIMKQMESLMDKLDEAREFDYNEGEERFERVEFLYLDEGEYKLLKERVEDHDFDIYRKGNRIFTDDICDNAEKVEMEEKADANVEEIPSAA